MHAITTVSKKAGREDYQIAGLNVGKLEYVNGEWQGSTKADGLVAVSRSVSAARKLTLSALGKRGMPNTPALSRTIRTYKNHVVSSV